MILHPPKGCRKLEKSRFSMHFCQRWLRLQAWKGSMVINLKTEDTNKNRHCDLTSKTIGNHGKTMGKPMGKPMGKLMGKPYEPKEKKKQLTNNNWDAMGFVADL